MDCDWCGRRDDVTVLHIDERELPSFEARLCAVCQVLLDVGPLASSSDETTEWARTRVFRHLMRRDPVAGVPSLRCSTCGAVVPLNLVEHDDTGRRVLECPHCRDRTVLMPRRPA